MTGLKVGLIGLGIGTLTSYASERDHFKIYELNPDVEPLADRCFYFLANNRATTELVSGDARLSLQHETPQNFDILVVDAFNGGTIPVHLLTLEAWNLY